MPTGPASEEKPDYQVFISYSHTDNELPQDANKSRCAGFVTYLARRLKHDLRQAGLANCAVWLDLENVHGDADRIIAEELTNSDILLPVVSLNFVQRHYCIDEVQTFLRNRTVDNIFRVDKHAVANDLLPEELRKTRNMPVPFYTRDESGNVIDFYRLGRPVRQRALDEAIKKLADQISLRLKQIKPPITAKPDLSSLTRHIGERDAVKPLPAPAPPPRQAPARTVFVSKPAFDMTDPYVSVVRSLQGRNIAVVPDPETKAPTEAGEFLGYVRAALAKADASIHLVGEGPGFRPEPLLHGIVSLQLAEARAVAAQNEQFKRLIWVPAIVPNSDSGSGERQPDAVVNQLDRQIDSDQLFSDTAAQFAGYLLQHLVPQPRPALPSRPVYVTASTADYRRHAVPVAKQIIALGGKATPLNTMLPSLHAFGSFAFCWGEADETDVINALDTASRQFAASPGTEGKVCLLLCPPDSEIKQDAAELGSFGTADLIIDARQALRNSDLELLLGRKG